MEREQEGKTTKLAIVIETEELRTKMREEEESGSLTADPDRALGHPSTTPRWQRLLSLLGYAPPYPGHSIRPGALARVLLLIQGCGGSWTCADTSAVVWQQDGLSAESCQVVAPLIVSGLSSLGVLTVYAEGGDLGYVYGDLLYPAPGVACR
jgi:hypothetical protein